MQVFLLTQNILHSLNVGKNTDLKGAVIASEAEKEKNKVSTETLTYEDIENKAEYNAKSSEIGGTIKPGKKLQEDGTVEDATIKKPDMSLGMPVKDKAESTTKSAIEEGTVEVRSEEGKDLNALSRDTENALNKLEEIFDKEEVKEKQELVKLFGEEAFRGVHEWANHEREKAWKAYNEAKERGAEQEELEKLKENIKAWDEGGTNKIFLHSLIGGIMAELSGGEILSGALGAGINETLIKEIGKIKDPAMQQIVSAIIGGVAGELAGGEAQTGAGTAASGTKNNHFAGLEINDHLSNAVLMVLGYEVIVLEDGQQKIVDEFGKVVALCDSVGDWLLENSDSVMNEVGTSKEDFIKWAKESSKSQKERAKDIPSWAKGEKPSEGESGKDFAERLCNEKFGKGNYKKGPRSDFNKLKKYGDRNF